MSLVRVDTGALLTMVGEAEGSATDGSPFGSSIEKIGNTPETGVRDELRVIRESLPEDNCNIRDLTTVGNRVLVTRTLCGTESTRIMQLRGCVHNIVNTSPIGIAYSKCLGLLDSLIQLHSFFMIY